MDELCQLCLKTGIKRKIKAIQVNLTEALWMCENEECLWPFGYEKPKIFSRRVGDKWAFEWQMYRKAQKTVGQIPVSAELSLYTPPVTPSGDVASKETIKTDLTQVTNVSWSRKNNNAFSNELVPRDTYAPGFGEFTTSDNVAPCRYKDHSPIVSETSSVSSIFDIDSDKSLGNTFRGEPTSMCQAARQSMESHLDVTISKTVDNQTDLVFETSHETEPIIEKPLQNEKMFNTATVNMDTHIARSISTINMNLKSNSPSKVVKKENLYLLDSKPLEPVRLSDVSDNLSHPKQCTATITLEGIPSITLSYDLADLCEKSKTVVPVTSTLIDRATKRSVNPLIDNNCEEKSKPLDELPKKQVNFSSKRRTDHRKKYEKFSFSALRKTTQDMKECSETTLNEVHCKKEESLGSESRLGVVSLGVPMVISGSKDVNNSKQMDESLTLLNVDANNSNSVENLNLSCMLDDMLLDGCQNVTKNLNDDWLESFFT